MTPADKLRAFLLSILSDDYQLGGENKDTDGDGRREIDCSGTYHQGSTVAGFPIPDDTAAGYYGRMTKRTGALQPGDAGFLEDSSGHVHHMCVVVGDGTEVEARSSSYPTGKEVQRRPTSDFAASPEFAGWRYWPGHNFGKLTTNGIMPGGIAYTATGIDHPALGGGKSAPWGLSRSTKLEVLVKVGVDTWRVRVLSGAHTGAVVYLRTAQIKIV